MGWHISWEEYVFSITQYNTTTHEENKDMKTQDFMEKACEQIVNEVDPKTIVSGAGAVVKRIGDLFEFMGEGAKLVRGAGAYQLLCNEAEKARGVDEGLHGEITRMKCLKLAQVCEVKGYEYEGENLSGNNGVKRDPRITSPKRDEHGHIIS